MPKVNRRSFGALAASSIALAASDAVAKRNAQLALQGEKYHVDRPSAAPRPKVAMLLFPGVTPLDLIGPQTVLNAHCDVHLVWKNTDVMMSDSGVVLQADTLVEDCPQDLDVLFVPGGPGQVDIMHDDMLLRLLADRGARAKYVTSVCSGALVLGAAGLLKGYDAATHWAAMGLLPLFGANPVEKRVVKDRNRITGGGVTAGLDFGLALLAEVTDEHTAKVQQLAMQYDPEPPFDVGVPAKAGPEITNAAISWMVSAGIDMAEVSRKAAEVMDKYH
ncbi:MULTISPECIES: DJ-1/PfpI family protein [unclassified Rhizobium]|uniref:DJ-1/PfpI family protein n=1 Tax=unclassified Rhizobium TaxID=2613769 RepID=UPI00178393C9|nr:MULTISPECIES: DJ-1/PfpI family protein [unclassified Rhizobium]MBD8688846.1 DJ-1/PfpI family protein [Rhizobium sp. CFBP 13644]MBD8694183.1 DJ-1/PfpI family protein [Rhizobium sp. CFBP 13717]